MAGRPNVGKSTLFNRLIGRRHAVVSATRGTTRDRLFGTLTWNGALLTLIDAGGMELKRTAGLAASVQRHVQQAVQEADGIVLVCDAQEGLVPADGLILQRLRRLNKPIWLAVNKVDDGPTMPAEFYTLGLAEPLPVSALHGRGTGELLDRLTRHFTPPHGAGFTHVASASRREAELSIAVVGRQNVGKSSWVNAVLRQERVIVSEMPGTTRDAVDTDVLVGETLICLIDTAGLRHRRKVREPVDHFAMLRTRDVLGRCDVALVLLDATQRMTRDDQRLLTTVAEAGCGCVIAVNKWDLVKGGREAALADMVHRQASSVPFAPVIAVSAKTGFHVMKSLELARQAAASIRRGLVQRLSLSWIQQAWKQQPPPRWRGRAIHLQRVRWSAGRPNALHLTLRPVGWLSRPYQQYLMKRLYTHHELAGVPVTLLLEGPTPR